MSRIHHEWHIWELADEHDVQVVWSRKRKHRERVNGSWGGTAHSHDRWIELHWQSEGEDPYWVALHEIAHVALDHCGLPETPEGTAGEAEAWAWALERAIAPPSLEQITRIRQRLANYSRDRGEHPRVGEVLAAFEDTLMTGDLV